MNVSPVWAVIRIALCVFFILVLGYLIGAAL